MKTVTRAFITDAQYLNYSDLGKMPDYRVGLHSSPLFLCVFILIIETIAVLKAYRLMVIV